MKEKKGRDVCMKDSRKRGKRICGIVADILVLVLMVGMPVRAAGTVVGNLRFTSNEEMQRKTGSTDPEDWSPKYLTSIESIYWNFADEEDRNMQTISTNLASNAYQNLEMFLDNGYKMDYNVLKALCEDYKIRAGREDAYYLILFDCLKNPYLLHKPEAVVTASSYNGRDYTAVFDPQYYYDHNPDLQQTIGRNAPELLRHFVECGINEGRRGNAIFSMDAYMGEQDGKAYQQLLHTYGYDGIDGLGKYSYSPANYYGTYLGHYNYESVYQEETEESAENDEVSNLNHGFSDIDRKLVLQQKENEHGGTI